MKVSLGQIPHESQWEEYEGLQKNEVLDPKHLRTVRDGEHESPQVLRHENDVRRNESELRDCDGAQDGESHPSAIQSAADVAETPGNDEFGLDEQQERP